MNELKDNFNKDLTSIDCIIKEARNKNKLVLFIGAGLSRLCGLPSWDALANDLISKCKEDNYINYEEKNLLNNGNFSSIQKISIIKEKYRDADHLDSFNKEIAKGLTYKSNENNDAVKTEILDILRKIDAQILTTNADDILDDLYKDNETNICFNCNKIKTLKQLDEYKLIHIHGSIKQPKSLIFAADDYAKLYSNNSFTKLLKDLFKSSNKVFLFVGYGLNDAELVRYIAGNGLNKNTKAYILNGYYKNDVVIKKSYKNYYKNLDIEQIAYSLDENEYREQLTVLNDIGDRIQKYISKKDNAEIYKQIKRIIDLMPTDENARYIKRNFINVENYLPSFIKSSCYKREWIIELLNDNYNFFDPLEYIVMPENLKKDSQNNFNEYINLLEENIDNETIYQKSRDFICSLYNVLRGNRSYIRYTPACSVLHLMFSSTRFIDDIDNIPEIINRFLKMPSIEPADIFAIIFDNRDVCIKIKPERYLDILYSVLNEQIKSKNDYICDEDQYTEIVLERIVDAPYLYFKKFITLFEKALNIGLIDRYSMGSFILYPEEYYDSEFGTLLTESLKKAIDLLDSIYYKKALESIVKKAKKDEMFSRVAVYILYSHISEINLLDYKDLIMNEEVYSDLCCLLKEWNKVYGNTETNISANKIKDGIIDCINLSGFNQKSKDELLLFLNGSEPKYTPKEIDSFDYWKNRNKEGFISSTNDDDDERDEAYEQLKNKSLNEAIKIYNNASEFNRHYGMNEAFSLYLLENKKLIDKDAFTIDKLPLNYVTFLATDAEHFENKNGYFAFLNKAFDKHLINDESDLKKICYTLKNITIEDKEYAISITQLLQKFPMDKLVFSNEYLPNYKEENIFAFIDGLPYVYFDCLFYSTVLCDDINVSNVSYKLFEGFIDKKINRNICDSLCCGLFTYIEILFRNNKGIIDKFLYRFRECNHPIYNFCLFRLKGFLTIPRYNLFKDMDNFKKFLVSKPKTSGCKKTLLDFQKYVLDLYINNYDDTNYELLIKKFNSGLFNYELSKYYKSPDFKNTGRLLIYLKDISKFDELNFSDNNIYYQASEIVAKLIIGFPSENYLWKILINISTYFRYNIQENLLDLFKKYATEKASNCKQVYINMISSNRYMSSTTTKETKKLKQIYDLFADNEKNEIYSAIKSNISRLKKLDELILADGLGDKE